MVKIHSIREEVEREKERNHSLAASLATARVCERERTELRAELERLRDAESEAYCEREMFRAELERQREKNAKMEKEVEAAQRQNALRQSFAVASASGGGVAVDVRSSVSVKNNHRNELSSGSDDDVIVVTKPAAAQCMLAFWPLV